VRRDGIRRQMITAAWSCKENENGWSEDVEKGFRIIF
jgi:hypothetical protein